VYAVPPQFRHVLIDASDEPSSRICQYLPLVEGRRSQFIGFHFSAPHTMFPNRFNHSLIPLFPDPFVSVVVACLATFFSRLDKGASVRRYLGGSQICAIPASLNLSGRETSIKGDLRCNPNSREHAPLSPADTTSTPRKY